MEEARAFFESWSRPNREALAYLGRLYPDELVYFGKRVAKTAVMDEKTRFAERWVERAYRVQPEAMSATCRPDGLCEVSGIVRFKAYSRTANKTSVGTARFVFVFSIREPVTLVSEAGDVITRTHYKGR